MEHTKNNKSFLFLAISAISSIITIVDFCIRYIKTEKIEISNFSIIGIIVFIISLLLFLIIRYPVIRYNIIKNIRYIFHFSEAYEIVSKKSEYIIIDKKHMEHIKTLKIRSKVSQFSAIDDKFRWSKPQSYNELEDMKKNISCAPAGSSLTFNRVETWIKYTVKLNEELGKGQCTTITVSIKNLEDLDEKSLPFLAGNTIVKTKALILKVVFKDTNLSPQKTNLKIFSNYASEYPIITKSLELKLNPKENSKYIEYIETKPIPGYRYAIYWTY